MSRYGLAKPFSEWMGFLELEVVGKTKHFFNLKKWFRVVDYTYDLLLFTRWHIQFPSKYIFASFRGQRADQLIISLVHEDTNRFTSSPLRRIRSLFKQRARCVEQPLSV